jgi:rubredoxin
MNNYQCDSCNAVFSEDEALRSSGMDCSEYAGTVAYQYSTYLSCCECGCEEISEFKGANDDESEDSN